jgi:hypothetical protein
VSRVFNESGYVKGETSALVKKIADDMGFAPRKYTHKSAVVEKLWKYRYNDNPDQQSVLFRCHNRHKRDFSDHDVMLTITILGKIPT